MLQWLQLTVMLLLTLAVRGREMQCDQIGFYSLQGPSCWSSRLKDEVDCVGCTIKNQLIVDEVLTIRPQLANGIDVDCEYVQFNGGVLTKLPQVIHKTTKQPIVQMELVNTSTHLLDAQFFEKVADTLEYFENSGNDKMAVAAFAFQNCQNLVELDLEVDGDSVIAADAFRGLHKLKTFHLSSKQQLNADWLLDLHSLTILSLYRNELAAIPETAFDNLPKLALLLLNENNIRTLTRRMFQNNKHLQKIYLRYNLIKVIDLGTFAHLQLTKLDLRDNECIDKDFENKTSEKIAEGLTACYQKNCVIHQITNGYVVNTKNNIRQTPGDFLVHLDSVKVVCDHTYLLFHKKDTQLENKCTNNDWTSQDWPTCERE